MSVYIGINTWIRIQKVIDSKGHVQDITGLVKKGSYDIRIKVAFTLGNYMKSLKDNAVAQGWTGHQPFHPMGLVGPVQIM